MDIDKVRMDEEYRTSNLSNRASSETAAGSSSHHYQLEKESLMTDEPRMPVRRPFWRRHLIPFCIHLGIFLAYTTLALFALDSRTKTVQQSGSFLHCAFPPRQMLGR